jgi:hypothetical protein
LKERKKKKKGKKEKEREKEKEENIWKKKLKILFLKKTEFKGVGIPCR